MYHHIKKTMYLVHVVDPDPRFGAMLLEQFAGANGELAAAMQYTLQGLNCPNPDYKDLLLDIGTEELGHLEVVGNLARLHLKPMKQIHRPSQVDPLIAIGGGVNLFNAHGKPWTADYLEVTGDLAVDLRSDIAAEARAKLAYERLIGFCDDPGTKDALQFLMTREVAHMRAFAAALESLGLAPFSVGRIPPSAEIVDHFINDSTGAGDSGDMIDADAVGPWNDGKLLEGIESPVIQELRGGYGTRHRARTDGRGHRP